MLATTYRRQLFERALARDGFVTTDDARELDIPTVELRKLAARGGLHQVGHGVYRFDDVPRTDRDPYMEAVLRVGPGSYLAGESVLALHDLAFVNPTTIRVATRRRVRITLPASIEVVRDDAPEDQHTEYEGIPSLTVAQALRDCRGSLMRDRLMEALEEALRRGLISRREADELRGELSATA